MSEQEISEPAALVAALIEAPPVELGYGAQLKAAREQRGMSLADVAQRLKYAARQVQALEEGRFDVLPGLTFQRGFVRGYARLLGLDPNNLVLQLEREAGQQTGPITAQLQQIAYVPATLPVRSEHTTAWPWILAMLLAVVGIGGYTLYKWEAPPGVRNAEQTAVPVADTRVQEAGSVRAAHTAGPAGSSAVEQSVRDSMFGNAVGNPAGNAASSAAGERPIPLPQPAADVVAGGGLALATGIGKIRLRFSGESWVEARQGNGALVYSGLSGAGTEQWVDGQPPFDLVIGNARVVRLHYRGAEINLEPYTKGTVAKVQLK